MKTKKKVKLLQLKENGKQLSPVLPENVKNYLIFLIVAQI
jgi:hypothetical protein